MAGSRKHTAKPTTDSLSAAELVRTVVTIRRSLLLGLPPMQRTHVEQCSKCADLLAAFVRLVMTHAPVADQGTLTLVRRALQQSAEK